MKFIAHRINTIETLNDIPYKYGVELDLRDNLDGRIYIAHNPFEPGEDFEEYLRHYNHHGTMIANIKSERIEELALQLLDKYNVRDFFFLDSTFPMIKLLSDKGIKNIALRYSEYEGIDTIKNMAGKIDWVWVDTFSKIPVNKAIVDDMHNMGYKVCLVSPELQGQQEKMDDYINQVKKEKLNFDAVCTKAYNIVRWESSMEKF